MGSSGQVGWELQRSLLAVGDVVTVPRDEISSKNLDALQTRFLKVRPTIVVNAAAYTAVDPAETETSAATWLNEQLPARIAKLTKKCDALLVDYSTDYVFDGEKVGDYFENDKTNPINRYGLTKLKGLEAIQASGCRHLVFRVSWVYSSRRNNFLKTILRLAQERDSLNVIDDQIGTPTSARWIAEMTCQALQLLDREQGSEGLYNLTPRGSTSWQGFAQKIVAAARQQGAELKLDQDSIQPIASSEYPTAAARPNNSRLSKRKIESEFGFEVSDWETFVPLIVEESLKP